MSLSPSPLKCKSDIKTRGAGPKTSVWGQRKSYQEGKISRLLTSRFSCFLVFWRLKKNFLNAGHLLLINVWCSLKRMQGKNKRFMATFGPDPFSPLHICLQEEYHLAALVRWGLCEWVSALPCAGRVGPCLSFHNSDAQELNFWVQHYLPHSLVEIKKRNLTCHFK